MFSIRTSIAPHNFFSPCCVQIKSLGYKSVAHYLVLTRRGDNQNEAEEKVVPSSGDMKVKEAPKVDEVKEPLAEEGVPVPQMHIEDPVSAVKQEVATSETSDKNAPLELISAKVEAANLDQKLEEILEPEVLPSSLVETPKVEKPVKLEKVPGLQATLLTAGFRSRRAVSTISKEGGDKAVKTNVAKNEAANGEVEAEEPKNRRGRPRKIPPLGKASFYGSAPRARRETKPESKMSILLLNSDTDSSSNFDSREAVPIARRLQRRRVT